MNPLQLAVIVALMAPSLPVLAESLQPTQTNSYSPLELAAPPGSSQTYLATPHVQPALQRPRSGRFDFQFVSVAQLVSLLYAEAMKTPYVIAPEVLEDQRQVSFRYDAKSGQIRDFLATFLDSLGFGVERRDGVDFVYKKLAPDPNMAFDREAFVYEPRFRDAHYLTRQAQPLFQGQFLDNRAVATSKPIPATAKAPPGSAAAHIDQQSDMVIFYGTPKEVAQLEKLLPLIDTPSGEVAIKAAAYEVTYSDDSGSAFHAALKVLGQGATLGMTGPKTLGNALTFRFKGSEAVFSALSQDSRFKVINEPNLRIRSGAVGKLTVGQKVPILGAVTYPRGGGQPVQSVEYHSSGVIFELRPVVKKDIIDVHVTQQISDFVRTTTGVNSSPTLNTREISTDISVEDGDVILLGGLTTNKETDSRAGLSFLPRFLDGTASSQMKTEILVVLHVQKV